MSQGASKNLAGKRVSGGRDMSGQITKKGKREIAPKKLVRVKAVAAQKKLSSAINRSIEKQMVQAASAGKLTIMKGANDGDAAPVKGKGKGKA